MNFPFCVLGIGGYSGYGKTTLIEKVLARLKREELYAGVLKHASDHRLSFDREGKDSERFYRAGAAYVVAHDRHQAFSRFRLQEGSLSDALAFFPAGPL